MPNIVEERIRRWKNKLIDLSKRNRLLNFKLTKVSTIRIIEEIPSEIYRILVLDGSKMAFLPLPENNEDLSNKDNAEKKEHVPKVFKKYNRDDLDEKFTDLFLQTNLDEKQLDKNLFRIFSISSSVMEEQGYNSLFLALGFLEWYESKDSDVKFKAPIILIPVELSRKSIRGPFLVSYTEESPILNPALVYKLALDFGVKIGQLNEELENIEEPQEIFNKVKEAIGNYKRWQVTTDVSLGIFSFSKFIMFKDLEVNMDKLVNSEQIKIICGIQQEKESSLDQICPYDEIEKRTQPLKTFQILEADSSQQRAMLVIKKGHNIIIEGPPGTGKSQTIANIIAEGLAEGKHILFVSQKMAALEVVKRRLESASLGDYCLELHSRKTNKKRVIDELGKVMHQEKKPDHSHNQELLKLERLREELGCYVKELHKPFGKLEMSPFKAMGIVNYRTDIEDLAFLFSNPEEWDRNKFELCFELLDRLGRNLINIQNPLHHPWRGSGLTELAYSTKLNLREVINSILEAITNLKSSVQKLCQICSYIDVYSIKDIESLIDAADILADSPSSSRSILENPRWNSLSAEIDDLIKTVKKFNSFQNESEKIYELSIIKQDIESLLISYRKYSRNLFFFLCPSYWKNRKLLKKYLLKKEKKSFKELVKELEKSIEVKQTALKMDNFDNLGKELFGSFWKGRDSDWVELDKFSEWIIRFRYHAIKSHFKDSVFAEDKHENFDRAELKSLHSQANNQLKKFKELSKSFINLTKFDENAAFNQKYEETNLEDIHKKIFNMYNTIDEADPWFSYQGVLQKCEKEELGDFIKVFLERNIPYEKIADTFKCQFLRCWIDVAFSRRLVLRNFQGKNHEQLIETFQGLDSKQIELAKIRAQHILSGNYDLSWEGSRSSERGILEREVRKTRAHKPLRKLFQEIPHLLLFLKPCLMMSPLSVAQFLNLNLFEFDLIIFDEASQVPPEDSIGAIMRGKQVVIAGDTKQLPPTSFFQSAVITPEDEEEDFEDYIPEDLDSILDECAAVGFPRTTLKWHYRSRHESLIAFSNKNFYDYRLNTFPNSVEESDYLGLKFHYMPATVYKRAGVNVEEAMEIAKHVFKHFKENPDQTLGVGTFSIKQKYAVEDAIEKLRQEDNSLEEFFSGDKQEHFFVKNLESIQGDERDVIFLSIGYGKDAQGRLSMNFGPINKLGGERRLNVLVTRARLRVEVFSSIRGADFDLSRTESSGAHLLKKYLDYAEMGKEVLLQDIDFSAEQAFSESPFEESVYEALVRKGIKTHKQVGCSGYRIDLAVVDPANPGRYILGIECDGACYHSCVTTRDRDRLRQQVLEDLGWTIYRIWSTDWYKNGKIEIEKLLDVINQVREGRIKKKLQKSINLK